MFDRKAYITMYVECKTRSVLDRNLICFKITPPTTTQLTSFFLAAHFTRPHVHLIIVVSLSLATRQCVLICSSCLKLQPLSYPSPAKKIQPNLKTKRQHHPPAVPAPPPVALVDGGVVEVGDWAVRSHLSAWLQITTSILPTRPKKSTKIPW